MDNAKQDAFEAMLEMHNALKDRINREEPDLQVLWEESEAALDAMHHADCAEMQAMYEADRAAMEAA